MSFLEQLKNREYNLKNEILSGLTVALALVPEAVAFSIIAGVSPLIGLYSAFIIGLITAVFGGRPGMISGATGAIAVVVVGNNWVEQRASQALAERELQIAALADRAVQDALENALSGAAVSLSDAHLAGMVSITPTRTYQSETKHWCREFVENVMIDGQQTTRFGIACRESEGGWRRVQTRLPGSTPPPVGTDL